MSSARLGLGDWSFEPTVTVGIALVVAAYVAALRSRRLSAADDVSPWFRSHAARPVCLGLGVLSALLALESPVDTGGDRYLLTLHMVQHMVLMMVSPPLVLLGVAGMRPPAGRTWPRLRRSWTAMTRPWPATVIFTAILLVWHLPVLYDGTLTNEPLHVVEHLTFIAAGVLFWWPIVDPVRAPETVIVGPFQKIAMLVLAGIPPTVLGFVFALGSRAYYGFYEQAPRLWGLSPVADQQLAGVVMLGAGNLIYFAAISVIFLRMFGSAADDEAAVDAAARAS